MPSRILIVEDNASLLYIYKTLLNRSGYEADGAADGLEGWKAITAKDYDLIITDNDMPHLTGLELVSRMRAAYVNVPVILVSGKASKIDKGSIASLGISVLMGKTEGIPEFLKSIKDVLDLHKNKSVS